LAGQSLKTYLIESFSTRDLVICWDRASGFSLPTAPMRQRFIDVAGIPLPGSSPTSAGTTSARGSGLAGGLNRVAATTTGSDLAAVLEKIRKPETPWTSSRACCTGGLLSRLVKTTLHSESP